MEADLKLDDLYVLLFEQNHVTENLSKDDAASKVSRPQWEQVIEESDAGKIGVHHAHHVNTGCHSERITSQEAKALEVQGNRFQNSSGSASSAEAIQFQQTKTFQHLQHQIAVLEDQKCELMRS